MSGERLHLSGDAFRKKVIQILGPLGFKVLRTLYPYDCLMKDLHNTQTQHRLDILFVRQTPNGQNKLCLVESKRSMGGTVIDDEIGVVANKAQCWDLQNQNLGLGQIDEAYIISEENLGPVRLGRFQQAAASVYRNRTKKIGYIGGPRLDLVDAVSDYIRRNSRRTVVTSYANGMQYDRIRNAEHSLPLEWTTSEDTVYIIRHTQVEVGVAAVSLQGQYSCSDWERDYNTITDRRWRIEEIHSIADFPDDLVRTIRGLPLRIPLFAHEAKQVHFGRRDGYTSLS